jgi:hypothetical protein
VSPRADSLTRPSNEPKSVYVTGTFDNWSKSTKLSLTGEKFKATISVPKEKIVFKFVVDGQWITTSLFKTEKDNMGIENNVIYPDDLDEVGERETGNYPSEAETTSFTNVSFGDMSPFEQYDTDAAQFEMDEEDQNEDLESSTQVTLSGTQTPVNLVSVADGDRQVRYYTSMSLLSKFTKYFK